VILLAEVVTEVEIEVTGLPIRLTKPAVLPTVAVSVFRDTRIYDRVEEVTEIAVADKVCAWPLVIVATEVAVLVIAFPTRLTNIDVELEVALANLPTLLTAVVVLATVALIAFIRTLVAARETTLLTVALIVFVTRLATVDTVGETTDSTRLGKRTIVAVTAEVRLNILPTRLIIPPPVADPKSYIPVGGGSPVTTVVPTSPI
jgi:hypothetical protein